MGTEHGSWIALESHPPWRGRSIKRFPRGVACLAISGHAGHPAIMLRVVNQIAEDGACVAHDGLARPCLREEVSLTNFISALHAPRRLVVGGQGKEFCLLARDVFPGAQ